MNKPEISILVPSIRPQNLSQVYNSICESTKRSFELVIVGPYPLPKELEEKKNVKFCRDFGSPTRASNIGVQLCEGKIFCHFADDGIMFPDALDKNIDILYSMGDNYKNVVAAKYYEGKNGTNKILQPDSYFKINGADCTRSPHIPDHYWIFNVAIMYTEFLLEMGAWDCEYEVGPMAHSDLAVRAQFSGANVKMTDIPFSDTDHDQIDHKPIEIAQITHDEKLFQSRYRDPGWMMREMKIDINNWRNASTVWKRRFG